MEGTRPLRATVDSALKLIAKRLRDDGESVTHEELPQRRVDLILYLDERSGARKRAHARNEASGIKQSATARPSARAWYDFGQYGQC